MEATQYLSRRRFLTAASAVGCSALAGCAGEDGDATETMGTAGPTDDTEGTRSPVETTTDGPSDLVGAIEREAVPMELTDPSANLDAVAATLAESSIVGLGENSHGVRELKTIPHQLVRRLVADHGYRLVAIEGTLGDFAPVNAYVTRGEGDLDAAMSSLGFYFWQTEEIRRLFEWLRAFNEGRSESEQAVVHGYDAQHFDVNAAAVESYLERVDPAYLTEVADSLDPLTTPLYRESDATFVTDEQETTVDDLESRLQSRRRRYVAESSTAEWELAVRHVWTLERGLQFHAALAEQDFSRGKTVRDAAMAENVTWLREWTNADGVVVLGNSNHTMRGHGGDQEQGARMGQHLSEEYGVDYYSLGLLFGTGSFTAPTGHDEMAFETFEIGGPVEDTLSATLASVSSPELFLDFETARERGRIDTWIDETSRLQFTVPSAPDRGGVPLPADGSVYDGVVFVRDVSPASFSLANRTDN